MTQVPDGILVSIHIRLRGGVQYTRRDIDVERRESTEVSRWETTKVVTDAQELKTASEVRIRAGYLVRRVCVLTSFGLICPAEKESELQSAIAEARNLVDQYNTTARYTFMDMSILCGRVCGTDSETVRAFARELATVLEELETASERVEVPRLREAASRARRLTALLPDDVRTQVEELITQARRGAREVVRNEATNLAGVAQMARVIRLRTESQSQPQA